MSSRLRKLSIWLALVAYCLTGVVSARGLVLCMEPDGHLSLEAQAAGCGSCCADDKPEDARERLVSCPCVDVPIGGPDAVQLRLKAADLAPADACERASFVPAEPRPSRTLNGAGTVPRVLASSALAQQRTVVLLV